MMSEQTTGSYELAVLYEEARRRREEGNASGAFARYRRLIELFEARGDSRTLAELQAEIGDMYQRMCELVPARHWFSQSLAGFEALDDRDAAARIRLNLGEIALVEGALTLARDHFEAAARAEAIDVSGLATSQLASLALTQGADSQGLALLCESYSSLADHPAEKDTVRRQIERWARQMTPARFRRLLRRLELDPALRAEIEEVVRQ